MHEDGSNSDFMLVKDLLVTCELVALPPMLIQSLQ